MSRPWGAITLTQTHVDRYSNTFITNLLNRAYLNDAFKARDGRIFNQFKVSLTGASRGIDFRRDENQVSEDDGVGEPGARLTQIGTGV